MKYPLCGDHPYPLTRCPRSGSTLISQIPDSPPLNPDNQQQALAQMEVIWVAGIEWMVFRVGCGKGEEITQKAECQIG